MRRSIMAGAALVLLAAGPAGDKPDWMKWDGARAKAPGADLPILVYSVTDQKGGNC